MSNSIIDHLTIGVKDFEKSKAFYDTVLKSLGYDKCMEFGKNAAFGEKGVPSFWLSGNTSILPKLHFSFIAPDHESVDAFYKKAIELGATDNGKPGLRDYAPDYYAAYVIDLDGYKIEAVCKQ